MAIIRYTKYIYIIDNYIYAYTYIYLFLYMFLFLYYEYIKSDNIYIYRYELKTVDGISSFIFIVRQYFYSSNLPFAAEEQCF